MNNNTTTEPGSALDARQANPNIEGTMAASIAQINNDLNDHLYGFRWRKFINTWTSASQIDSGCGIYNIGEISSDYWSSICKNEKLQNVGDYVLIIFQWNGTESALRFSVGLLISCRMSNLIYVTVWNGEFNLT